MIRQAIRCSSIGLFSLVLGMTSISQADAINFYLGNGSLRAGRSGSYSYSGGQVDLPSGGANDQDTASRVLQKKWGFGADAANPSGALGDQSGASSGFQLSFQKTVRLATTTFSAVGTDDVVVKSDGMQGFSKSRPVKISKQISASPFGKANGKSLDLSALRRNDNFVLKSTQVQPVPEPLTILGSGLALGAGVLFERKRKKPKSKPKSL